jgi:delta8-fatty-acid desaturase
MQVTHRASDARPFLGPWPTIRTDLFPRLPRHSLKDASLLVRRYCADNDLSYRIHGFVDGNKGVLAVLRAVADQVEVLGQVAAAQAKGELH